MKHASQLFPIALQGLIEIGEKARKEKDQRERDMRNGDRETIRVSRKRARQMTLPLTK